MLWKQSENNYMFIFYRQVKQRETTMSMSSLIFIRSSSYADKYSPRTSFPITVLYASI